MKKKFSTMIIISLISTSIATNAQIRKKDIHTLPIPNHIRDYPGSEFLVKNIDHQKREFKNGNPGDGIILSYSKEIRSQKGFKKNTNATKPIPRLDKKLNRSPKFLGIFHGHKKFFHRHRSALGNSSLR